MAKAKTVAAFRAEFVGNEEALSDLLGRISMGTPLEVAAVEVKRPYTLLYEYLHSTPELIGRYDRALEAWGEKLVHETVGIADAVEGADSGPAVSAAKLRVETRLSAARSWNRKRYGERIEHQHTHTVDLGDRLRRAMEREKLGRQPRVIEASSVEVVPVLPARAEA